MKRRHVLALSLAVVSAAAGAHHAWTEIDTTRTVTLTGVVQSLDWVNPHASLVLVTRDGGAETRWTVEMSGLSRMESRGIERATVAVGRTLTIVASPARHESHVVRANRIRVDDAEHVLY